MRTKWSFALIAAAILGISTLCGSGPSLASEEMVFVRGGCFDMARDESVGREACVEDFYISRYEVTVGEFRAFVSETGYKTEAERGGGCFRSVSGSWVLDKKSSWMDPGFKQSESSPVVCLSWNDAAAFVKWKREKTGLPYRIPSEAEWERAARNGGIGAKYNAAEAEPSGGSSRTAPVGSHRPDFIGLFDMDGNVREFVMAWVDDAVDGPVSRPVHSARGASWTHCARDGRCPASAPAAEPGRVADLGLRVIMPSLDE